jgi:hypothetical protein
MNNPFLPLPLLHEGDSFILVVEPAGPGHVRLSQIIRYRNNQNVEGIEESYFDLDELTRRAVVRQVRRRHKGVTIMLQ